MAGGDADARVALQVPHRVGQGRGGHQLGIDIGLDAVGGQHRRGLLGEQHALDAAVIGNGHGLGLALRVLEQVVGKALGGLAHGVDVHPVGARADHAPQARGAKLQLPVKAVVDLVLLALDGLELFGQVLVIQRLLQPSFVFCHSRPSLPCPGPKSPQVLCLVFYD